MMDHERQVQGSAEKKKKHCKKKGPFWTVRRKCREALKRGRSIGMSVAVDGRKGRRERGRVVILTRMSGFNSKLK